MCLSENIISLNDEAIKIRQDLHRIPETGFNEFKTNEYICKYLKSINVEFENNIAKTGLVAFIKGLKGKKTIAFRADMDALSLYENNDVKYKSIHDGYMHACGHDGHMTMLLLLAKYLQKFNVNDNVILIFQPAEEGPGGAEIIIEEGILKKYNVDEIYGIHLHPEFDEGVIAISPGPVMAMTGEFDIDILTKSGHGAMPHTAIDGIVIASNFINQLQSIVSRNINPTEAAVITVGKIFGGERRNIIAEKVRLEGTTRAFSEEVFTLIEKRMYKLAESFEIAYDCKINIQYRKMYPPVINDENCVRKIIDANKSLKIEKFNPQMIAEDFSYYLKEIPGAFMFLGSKNIEKNYIFPLHNSKFNFNENILLYGVQSYINILKYSETNI